MRRSWMLGIVTALVVGAASLFLFRRDERRPDSGPLPTIHPGAADSSRVDHAATGSTEQPMRSEHEAPGAAELAMRIRGHVRRPDGSAIRAARVRAESTSGAAITVFSDADGSFELAPDDRRATPSRGMRVTLDAYHPEHAEHTVQTHWGAADIAITLFPWPSLELSVVDAAGQPVERFAVHTSWDVRIDSAHETVVGAAGQESANRSAADVPLQFHAGGHVRLGGLRPNRRHRLLVEPAPATGLAHSALQLVTPGDAGNPERLLVILPAVVSRRVRVVDATSGIGIEAVRLELLAAFEGVEPPLHALARRPHELGAIIDSEAQITASFQTARESAPGLPHVEALLHAAAETDAEGRAVLRCAPLARGTLRAFGANVPWCDPDFACDTGDTDEALIRVARGASIVGRLEWGDTSEAVLAAIPLRTETTAFDTRTTDTDGRDPPSAAAIVVLRRVGVEASATTPTSTSASRPPNVMPTVPTQRVPLWRDGHFVVHGVPPGDWQVQVYAPPTMLPFDFESAPLPLAFDPIRGVLDGMTRTVELRAR